MRRRILIASVLSDIPDIPDVPDMPDIPDVPDMPDIPDVPDMPDYLTIEALEDGLTASLSTNACEYCVDGDGNWKTLSAGTATESINAGQTLSFRGELTPNSSDGIGTFTISKKCNLKGNCMSMLFGDNAANNYSLSGKNYAFYELFYKCTNIVNVSNNFLPATTLASYCYMSMFRYCTRLTTTPELPATTLVSDCYGYMFYGCSSLTTAPELPATTLSDYCYSHLFHDCTSLTTAPELPATTLAYHCYFAMFYGCSSLTTALALPATTLANYCYYTMFNGCSKLNYIKMLATDISATDCLRYWVWGVASSGTFVKHPDMTSLSTGSSGIPSGWTVINDGEESGLTFPLYISLNNATQIDENYYEFEPSELSQSLLDWVQELGLNFDADHSVGGGNNDDGFINLISQNENYKIIIGDYELTTVATEHADPEVIFSNEENNCELCVAKDNSYVEFYIN